LINTLFLVLPLLALSLICIGISFFVSTLYVFFRDLPYFYELVCFVAWISSPVFYPAEIVPAEVKVFLRLNPLYPVIESLRQISLSGTLPDLGLMVHCFLNGLIIIVIGWYFFNSLKSGFMDLL
jgi:lipopolysaccharide transport system permease protein